jgi:hypothetical protein
VRRLLERGRAVTDLRMERLAIEHAREQGAPLLES